jgi:hypothetical protein
MDTERCACAVELQERGRSRQRARVLRSVRAGARAQRAAHESRRSRCGDICVRACTPRALVAQDEQGHLAHDLLPHALRSPRVGHRHRAAHGSCARRTNNITRLGRNRTPARSAAAACSLRSARTRGSRRTCTQRPHGALPVCQRAAGCEGAGSTAAAHVNCTSRQLRRRRRCPAARRGRQARVRRSAAPDATRRRASCGRERRRRVVQHGSARERAAARGASPA